MRVAELFEQTTDAVDWKQKAPLTTAQAVHIIQTECQAALQVYENQGLRAYRGITSSQPLIFLGKTSQRRMPMNSSYLLQDLTDQTLRSQLGSDAAVRSNSIFTTGRSDHAMGYGIPYVIFPKDTARFTWSPQLGDLVLDIDATHWTRFNSVSQLPMWRMFLALLKQHPELAGNTLLNQLIKFCETDTDYFQWYRQDLPRQLQKLPAPVWAAAEQSGFVDWLHSLGRIRMADLYRQGLAEFSAEQFLNRFQPRDDDWAQALQSGHEIYVSGQYVAIQAEHFIKLTSYADIFDLPSLIR